MPSWRSLMKIPGSWSGVGSVSQRYGSADPNQYKNVTDPQHWSVGSVTMYPMTATTGHLIVGNGRQEYHQEYHPIAAHVCWPQVSVLLAVSDLGNTRMLNLMSTYVHRYRTVNQGDSRSPNHAAGYLPNYFPIKRFLPEWKTRMGSPPEVSDSQDLPVRTIQQQQNREWPVLWIGIVFMLSQIRKMLEKLNFFYF